jgi:hypothetical protein
MERVEQRSVPVRPVRVVVLLALVVAGLMATPLGGWSAAGAASPPGAGVSQSNTVCAQHGGFGSLGATGSMHDVGINNKGSNDRPGATSWMFPNLNTGNTTGGNNNSICGGGNVPSPFA